MITVPANHYRKHFTPKFHIGDTFRPVVGAYTGDHVRTLCGAEFPIARVYKVNGGADIYVQDLAEVVHDSDGYEARKPECVSCRNAWNRITDYATHAPLAGMTPRPGEQWKAEIATVTR